MDNTTSKRITVYVAVDSPFAHRVRLALEEARARYDVIWIDIINKPDWYEKKVNPASRVPYLVYGGPELHPDEQVPADAVKIPESLVILEFIADLFPEARLLPADPSLRAAARLFCRAVDARFPNAFFPFMFLNGPAEEALVALEELQAMLPPAGYAVGGYSIADAAFLPILLRFHWMLKEDPGCLKPGVAKAALETFENPRFARLRQYMADGMARPSTAKTWDEAAIKEKFLLRLERLQKTGMINGFDRVPIPSPGQ